MDIIYYYLVFEFILLSYFISLAYPEYTRSLIFTIFLILVLFESVKNPLINDGAVYAGTFDSVTHFSDFIYIGREPAYSIFPMILKLLNIYNYYTIFAVFAIVGVGFKFKSFIKYSHLPLLVIVLYFPYFYIYFETSAIRAGCAVAIFLYAVQDIKNRKICSYLLKMAFAGVFHYSILIALPFYFMSAIKVRKRWYLAAILLVFTLDVSHINVVGKLLPTLAQIDRLSSYTTVGKFSGGQTFSPFSIGYFIWLLEAFIVFYNAEKFLKISEYSILFAKILYFGVFILYLLGPSASTLGYRFAEMFFISSCIILVNLLKNIKDPFNKVIFSCLLLLYSYRTLLASLGMNLVVDRHYY